MAEEINRPDEVVVNKIYLIRNHKVMLDKYLAELYGVERKVAGQDEKTDQIFSYLKKFIKDQKTLRIKVGFKK